MPERHYVRRSTVLAVLSALVLSACAAERLHESNAQIIPYHQVGDSVITFDPTTGTLIRTTQWQYADGYKTETVDRKPVTGANDFRRSEPAIRVTDP